MPAVSKHTKVCKCLMVHNSMVDTRRDFGPNQEQWPKAGLNGTYCFYLNFIASSPLIRCLVQLHFETLILVVLPHVLEATKAHQVLRLKIPTKTNSHSAIKLLTGAMARRGSDDIAHSGVSKGCGQVTNTARLPLCHSNHAMSPCLSSDACH